MNDSLPEPEAVKRYDPNQELSGIMTLASDGLYVKYEAYEKLKEAHDEWKIIALELQRQRRKALEEQR